jgi:3'-5' exoribonuclease
MKSQYVASLQEGDMVNDYFVAARKDLRTQQNGSKFLGMVFKDKTGEVGGILWNNAATVAALFELGDVVQVRGTVCSYQERPQIRVDQVLPLREGEFDVGDLVHVPQDTAVALEKLTTILATIKNEYISTLVNAFLSDESFMSKFALAAAGKRWHHAYRGGLVQHCYEVARIAETMCELFPQVNRDLLLAGVFLHDVGKLIEMNHDLLVDYTTPGRLLGHIYIGAGMVQRKIDLIPEFPDTLRMQILHMVLSHHGELVNGAPILPKTLEAIVLYHCDNLDAQTDAFQRVIAETSEKNQEWSEYFPTIDRQIWSCGGR